jgi:DNA-binding transcriptional ArsR family regulator
VTTQTDRVFAALSDPTRRQLLEWLGDEVATATSFAERLPISRQAVAKHLSELSGAGLVSSRREGRETVFSVETEGLAPASEWIEQRAAVWEQRLARLSETAQSGTEE